MIRRLLAKFGYVPLQTVTNTLPPIPARMVFEERPAVDFNRWDWDRDALPYLEWRLRTQLYRLLTEPDEGQFRYIQGQARELYEVISTPEVEQKLAQLRAQSERARR